MGKSADGREREMGEVRPPSELREFLHYYDPAVQTLGLGLRTVVLEEMSPCHEYIFAMRSKVVLLYSASEKVIADCVCSVAIFRHHATLSFHHGADLTDPQRLLRGTGKSLRHIRVARLEDLDRTQIRKLLREARRRSPLKTRPRSTPDHVVTRIKKQPAARTTFPRMF